MVGPLYGATTGVYMSPSALRQALYAQKLMQSGSDTSPAKSPLEGIARALQGGIGGYFANKAQNKELAYQQALSGALSQPDPLAALQGAAKENPDLAPALTQFTMANFQNKLALDLAKQKLNTEYGLKAQYEPQIAGATANAKVPAALAEAEGKAGIDLRFKPQIAGAEAAAQNPALIQRAGGIAQAQLPSQQQLAAFNAGLDVNKAGPIEAARLSAQNAPMTVQTPNGPQQVTAATAGDIAKAGPVEAARLAAQNTPTTVTLPGGQTIDTTAGAAKDIAQKTTEDRAKKVMGAQNIMNLIGDADGILDKATHSYIGAGVDQAARLFGASTEGSQAIAKLKALQAALVLNSPRLEGPQSDRDRALYEEAVGQIGDPTVPVPNKKAALSTVRTIYERYGAKMPESTGGSNSNLPALPPGFEVHP